MFVSDSYTRANEFTGWNYFDANECGFRELWKLFKLVRTRTGSTPLVIDADDLVEDPGAPEILNPSGR